MNKKISVFIALLLLLVIGSNAQFDGLVVTINQNVNIRVAPDENAERLGTVRSGTTMRLDGRVESGTWLRGITQNGTVGWIVSGPTGLSLSEIISLPIISPDSPFTLSPPEGGSAPAPSTSNTAPAVANNAPVRGFSYGGHIAGFEESAMNWMSYSGMTWVKKQWRYVDGQNPADAQGWIDAAHAYGFRILIGVVGFNKYDLNSDGYFDRYASFVAGLAALGADAIEVWNEPNIDHEWVEYQIDPARYTELLRVSYNAIKNANSNTLVISAAPAPTGAESAFPGRVMNDNNFLAGMAAAGAANYMDCIGAHYNEGILPPTATSGDPRGNSEYYTRYLPSMINVYYNAFRGRRPVCFTELGYLTPEGLGVLSSNFAWAENVTVAQQASWVDGAVNYAARSGRVRLVIIWNINFTNFGDDPMAGYALIRPGGGCPACEALAR